jgi:hypothetical protein
MNALKHRVLLVFSCGDVDRLAEVLQRIHQISIHPKNSTAGAMSLKSSAGCTTDEKLDAN